MDRVRVTAYMRQELVDWLDTLVEEGRFRSRSHGIEEGVQTFKQYLEGKLLAE